LFGVVYTLVSSRRRAVELAAAMTKDLRESEASLASAQQMARLGNWLFNPDSASMVWSAEIYRIFGCRPEPGSATCGAFWRHIHSQDRDRIHALFSHALASGEEIQAEHRISGDDGTVKWVQTIARMDTDTGGRALRGTIMDITERKLVILQTEFENRITQLAASTDDIDQVMPRMIETLCVSLGWHCGVYRALAKDGLRLRCTYDWGTASPTVQVFLAGQREMETPVGHGLAGRAWQADQSVAVRGIDDADAGCAAPGNPASFECGIAFPIRSGETTLGVVECFGGELGWAEDLLPHLLTSVSAQIGQYLQRKQAEQALRYMAAHDSLTELPNRSLLHQTLRHAVSRHARHGAGLAVMFIDLDRFKMVNDTVGHSAGDRLLQECARRLTECLRSSDIVARLGGDEFAVVIEQFSALNYVSTVAQKILLALNKPFFIDGQEFLLAASIGISTFPEDGVDAETLLKNADVAMYRAKSEGNAYYYYSSQLNAHNLARFTLETELRHAIARDELMLYFQPKLNLRSGRVTGVESLLRWRHPKLGMVSPVDFIPIAEETGLIIEIGQWVLKQACLQARQWQLHGYSWLRIAVNLSARQFAHKHLLHDISSMLVETGLAPESLELEITESVVMDNPEQAIKVLDELRAMGIHLSIDDFGTGYSSLAYLRKLPVDCVKIDRSFIKDIPFEADDMAISKSIISLGHSLRLMVVAEGVENEEQLRFMQEQGCDEIQGYVFSKPLPAREVPDFLAWEGVASRLMLAAVI
jgi:diguanylate cyclase (GGDEF)-like protein/PAS domain S-box-containing protein